MTNENGGHVTHRRYWPNDISALGQGYELELRARIALEMVEKWGQVAGKSDREDSQGRAVCDLQTVAEAVDRAFALADAFVDRAEARGEVRPQRDAVEAFQNGGKLMELRDRGRYMWSIDDKEDENLKGRLERLTALAAELRAKTVTP